MRRIVFFSLLLCCFPFLGKAQTGDAESVASVFFLSIEDMPLMSGLEELPQDTMSFDKPEGRIIESYAILRDGITREQVFTYYKVTLPQFGWGHVRGNQYFRGKEYLDLSFVEKDGQDFLKIMVKPSL